MYRVVKHFVEFIADPEKYGGIAKMYRECIRRGIAWEELLQWDGHSDEIDIC